MNKIFKSILVCFLSICLFSVVSVNASINNDSLKQYYREISNEQTVIYNTVTWEKIIGETRTDHPIGNYAGYGSEGAIDPQRWYGQQINVLSVPRYESSDGEVNYKVVAWSVQDTDKWSFAGATGIAEDYERTHPDYIVLGGINADFYDWHTTNDYPNSGNGMEIRDGDIVRALVTSWGAVGVKNDFSNNQLVYAMPTDQSVVSDTFVLQLLDDDDHVINEFALSGLNKEELQTNEYTALFGYNEIVYDYEVETYVDDEGVTRIKTDLAGNPIYKTDATGQYIHRLNSYGEWAIIERIYHAPSVPENGNVYYVIDGDLVIYQKEDNSYFGKGQIAKEAISRDYEIGPNDFAIVSNNESLNNLLNSFDGKIRVQRKLLGDFDGIENATGAYMPLVENGSFYDLYLDVDYFTTRAPRTLIGCTADGTIKLITMDGRQEKLNFFGTNQEEIDAILERLGVTDAYLLDGGGSTTFFVREDDKLVIKNSPSDGRQRSVANAFLVVAKRDTSVEITSSSSTSDSLTFDIRINNPEEVKDVFVLVNDKKYFAHDKKIVVDALEHNTSYDIQLFYKNSNGSNIQTTQFFTYQTDKMKPTVKIISVESDDKYLYPKLEVSDPDNAIKLIMLETDDDYLIYSLDEDAVNKIKYNSKNAKTNFNAFFTYQLNPKDSVKEEDFSFTYPLTTDEKSGCSFAGSIVVMMLSALSISFVLIKRKK